MRRVSARAALCWILAASGWLPSVPAGAAELPLLCANLQARVYDGVPGPGLLLASSASGCPFEATALHLHGDADSSVRVALAPSSLRHEHFVDIRSSGTNRIAISEAFFSFQLPDEVSEIEVAPSFGVDPLRFSSLLQWEHPGSHARVTLVAGSPLLPGEATVWQESRGSLVQSRFPFPAGSRVQAYSRLASYGEVRHEVGLSFSSVPEPSSLTLLATGIAPVAAGARRRALTREERRSP